MPTNGRQTASSNVHTSYGQCVEVRPATGNVECTVIVELVWVLAGGTHNKNTFEFILVHTARLNYLYCHK